MRTVRQLLEAKAPEIYAIDPDAAVHRRDPADGGEAHRCRAGDGGRRAWWASFPSATTRGRSCCMVVRPSDTPVRDIMTADVITVGPDDTPSIACR